MVAAYRWSSNAWRGESIAGGVNVQSQPAMGVLMQSISLESRQTCPKLVI